MQTVPRRDGARGMAVAVVLLAGLGACGGGGSDEGPMIFDLGGDVLREGTVSALGPVTLPNGFSFTGDDDEDDPGLVGRQCFSFAFAAVPHDREILSVEIVLEQRAVFGSPFLSHGPLLLDHVEIGDAIDAGDFDSSPLDGPSPVMAPNATTGTKIVDVTAQVMADIVSGRPRAQFRLRFAGVGSDGDAENDYAQMTDTAHAIPGVDHVPVLRFRLGRVLPTGANAPPGPWPP